ncbi:metal-dependent hydrolase [Alkanindiges sp. WGS2144]|uniref:metal-dependent hydrolase n=1 Tax=Alkanindiges sp. WGS2144 TaxID=3366808 RepID=UPI00375339B8
MKKLHRFAQSLQRGTANIPPRHMDFGFSSAKMPRYYADDNPLLTAVMTTLSSAIPDGERFFVESVRKFRHHISDSQLNAEISGFIGQEAFHARQHDVFNQALVQQGFSVDNHERIFRLPIQAMQRCPAVFQLAATAALEHYTAIIGEALLRDPEMQAKLAPLAREFWTWHALEETEHKSVAFDVYATVSGNYLLRVGTMLLISAVYWPLVLGMTFKMVADDKQLFKVGKLWSGLNFTLGPKGFFTRLAPKYLDYLKPGFHPTQHDTEALLEEWRNKLFGENGTLNQKIKNPAQRIA